MMPFCARAYFTELITLKTPSRYNLRYSCDLLLQRPMMKTLATLSDRSFAIAAPYPCCGTGGNRLPLEMRQATSVVI